MSDTRFGLAVVTGASRGLGTFIARELAEICERVVITGRHRETLLPAASRIGANVVPEVCDHGDAQSVLEWGERVRNEYGAPDVLINNAGILGPWKASTDISLDEWNKTIGTNLTGVFLTTQQFLPGMIERGRGEIIMISSTSGKRGHARGAAYNASKFGLNGYAEALSHEVRKSNIRVQILCPSRIDLTDPPGEEYGEGLTLHGADVAKTVRHIITLPGRTLIKEMEIWGTNP